MSKKLTRELIAQKVKSDRLESIRKLNLWGSNLGDISIISQMPSLEVVSLSVNKIHSLKPFANLKNLKELYLRQNAISNLNEIKYLTECDNLTKLWLKENPICENPNYRDVVICVLPQVQNLDEKEVTEDERIRAEKKLSGNYNEEEDDEEEQNKIEEINKEEEKFSPKKIPGGIKKTGYRGEEEQPSDEYENFHENKFKKDIRNKNKYDDEDEYIQPKKQYESKGGNKQYNNNYNDYDERPIKGSGKAQNQNYKKVKTYDDKNGNNYDDFSPKEKKKGNSNVLNVVINLLKELSTKELQIVKREIDRINDY